MLGGHLALAWMVLAVLLGGAELLAPGVSLVFIAIAAAITGLTALAVPDLPLSAQLLSLAVWSIAAILIGRRWYRDYPVETADPMLNDRGARLVGEIVIVTEPIIGGRGRVRLGDSEWLALGPDLPVGARARVAGVEATAVRIEPLSLAPASDPS